MKIIKAKNLDAGLRRHEAGSVVYILNLPLKDVVIASPPQVIRSLVAQFTPGDGIQFIQGDGIQFILSEALQFILSEVEGWRRRNLSALS